MPDLLLNESPKPGQTIIVGSTDSDNSKPKQKRSRVVKSCYRCRSRKAKCNFKIPCSRCIANDVAHLCSKYQIPTIENENINSIPNEVRLAQENEVLKKKIKDLETALLRSNHVNGVSNELLERNKKRKVIQLSQLDAEKKQVFGPHSEETDFVSLNSQELNNNWKNYTMTLGVLNKGIIDGFQAYDGHSFDWDSVEWSRIKRRKLIKGMRLMSKSNNDERSDVWNYQLKVISKITKHESDVILAQAICLPFVKTILDIDSFTEEYERHWEDETNKNKHITALYSETSTNYFFLGIYYNLMCLGLYFADESIQNQLGYSDNEWDFFPRSFFNCGIECLYRAGFMTYPNIRAIQIYLLMKVTARSLGGSNFVNCLLSVMIYQARKLKMDQIIDEEETYGVETELKKRCWWSLVTDDWFEDLSRYSLIAENSFITTPPGRWHVENKVIKWDSYFQLFSIQLSSIKKNYYYEDFVSPNSISLENLMKADTELKLLEIGTSRDFVQYMDNERLQNDESFSDYIDFLELLCHLQVLGERLQVNIKMSAMMTREDWVDQCYQTCYSSAKEIITNFTSRSVPTKLRSVSFVPELAVLGTIFLLVDSMLNVDSSNYQIYTDPLIHKVLETLGSYKHVMRPALRGKYMIQQLMTLTHSGDNPEGGGHLEKLKALKEETEHSINENSKSGYHKRKKLNPSKIKSVALEENGTDTQFFAYSDVKGITNSSSPAERDNVDVNFRSQGSDLRESSDYLEHQVHVQKSSDIEINDARNARKTTQTHTTLSANILDILEDTGWKHFLSTINDFQSA